MTLRPFEQLDAVLQVPVLRFLIASFVLWNESPVANLKTGAPRRLSRGDDPTKEAHMTKIILAAAAAATLLTTTPLVVGSTPAQAQSVEVGPGGIRVDPDRRDRRDYYRDRRDYRGGRRCRQSTRPERARVVVSFVKEGRCAGINAEVRTHLPGGEAES